MKFSSLFGLIKHKVTKVVPYRKQRFVYVAIGDSTAEGMGATAPERSYANIVAESLKDRYKHTEYHNFARSGSILADVIKRQLPKTIEVNPNLITISVGANDVIRRTSADEFEEQLDFLLDTLNRKTDAIVVISTVPDLSLTPSVPKLLKHYSKFMARRLNEVILSAGGQNNAVVIDMFNDSRAVLKAFPEAAASDGFHPSDLGYAIWANSIIITLRNVLASPRREQEINEEQDTEINE